MYFLMIHDSTCLIKEKGKGGYDIILSEPDSSGLRVRLGFITAYITAVLLVKEKKILSHTLTRSYDLPPNKGVCVHTVYSHRIKYGI